MYISDKLLHVSNELLVTPTTLENNLELSYKIYHVHILQAISSMTIYICKRSLDKNDPVTTVHKNNKWK